MPVPERERDADIYTAERRARRELLDEIVKFLYTSASSQAADEVLARFGDGEDHH